MEAFTHAVITSHYYGFGNSEQEALDECSKAGGKANLKNVGYMLYRLDRACYLSVHPYSGNLEWTTTDGSPGKDVVCHSSALLKGQS